MDITPSGPIRTFGYASRTKPSDGLLIPIFAKALALDDGRGARVVIVTTDLIGLPRSVTDPVGVRVQKEYNPDRSQLLINSSHTHTGPAIRGNLDLLTEFSSADRQLIDKYTQDLTGTGSFRTGDIEAV